MSANNFEQSADIPPASLPLGSNNVLRWLLPTKLLMVRFH
jgi:hypothetical protein